VKGGLFIKFSNAYISRAEGSPKAMVIKCGVQ